MRGGFDAVTATPTDHRTGRCALDHVALRFAGPPPHM
jgi:hypothetical protein